MSYENYQLTENKCKLKIIAVTAGIEGLSGKILFGNNFNRRKRACTVLVVVPLISQVYIAYSPK